MPQPLHVVSEKAACRCRASAEGTSPRRPICKGKHCGLQRGNDSPQSAPLQRHPRRFSLSNNHFVHTGWAYLASIKVHLR